MEEFDPTASSPRAQEPRSASGEETPPQFDNSVAEAEARTKPGRGRFLREIAETVVLTVVIFAVVNALTGRFRIEGPSMRPNLAEGQYLIINKIVYRLHPPQRGDIIVFNHPRNASRDLIKRVIALPGETVDVRQGQVYINDSPLEEPYVINKGNYSVHFELGTDEFFVLGDNRPNSDDSHNWGALEKDKIVGKAWLTYWPPSAWGGVPHFSYAHVAGLQGESVSQSDGG